MATTVEGIDLDAPAEVMNPYTGEIIHTTMGSLLRYGGTASFAGYEVVATYPPLEFEHPPTLEDRVARLEQIIFDKED